MRTRTRIALGGAAVAAVIAATTGIAVAGGDDDAGETPITGEALQRAEDAALEHTGSGEVTDTEVGDEDSYYEVEVTMPDGSQVDVQLDESFDVVGDETDGPGEDD